MIFATTTPPAPDMWGHDINRLKIYNEAAVATLSEMGILINDLFTPVASDIPTMIAEDHLHLSEAGVEVCAAQVADAIRKAAEA